MKILAFAATNSRTSINRSLVEFAAARLQATVSPETDIEFVDLNDFEMPIYSIDREIEGGVRPEAQSLFDKIGGVDALVVSFAEHNGSVTAAWKNVFDWMSRIDTKVWQDKPVVFLAATPGPRAGAGVLAGQEHLAPFFGADLRGVLGIGRWSESWDASTQSLVHDEDLRALDAVLAALTTAPTTAEEPA